MIGRRPDGVRCCWKGERMNAGDVASWDEPPVLAPPKGCGVGRSNELLISKWLAFVARFVSSMCDLTLCPTVRPSSSLLEGTGETLRISSWSFPSTNWTGVSKSTHT